MTTKTPAATPKHTAESHSPGPWTVNKSAADGQYYIGATVYGQINSVEVARVTRLKRGSEANARLIAAAPELLEALTEMVEMIDRGDEPGNGSRWHVKARAALEKARQE